MSVTHPLHDLRLRPHVYRDVRWAAAWVLAAAAAEAIGRLATHELVDLALAAALGSLVASTRVANRLRSISWWTAVTERIRAVSALRKGFWGACGIDLRGGGDVRSGLPRPRVVPVVVGALLLVPTLAVSGHLPHGLRAIGLATCYTVYLAVLGGLWAASLLGLFGFAFFAAGIWGDARIRAADNAGRPRSGRSPTPRISATPVVVAFVAALTPLPAVVPAAAIVVAVGVLAVIAAQRRCRAVRLIWRRNGGAPLRAALGAHLALEMLLVAIAALFVVVLTTGLTTDVGPTSLPLTALVGTAAAWSVAFALCALTWRLGVLAVSAARCDPAQPRRPCVRFATTPAPTAVEAVTAAGWHVRATDAPPLRGELVVDPDTLDLTSDDGLDRLVRRHRVVQRRLLRRGLQRLLRAAARFRYEQGTGFWIAPHLWIAPALSRDQDENASIHKGTGAIDQVLGPDHAHAFPASARAHCHTVFAAVGIDLIFLEDGVRWPGLKRVLGVVFEVYDMHGGRRRIEDRNFSGLTGLRVVLHDFDLDNPYRAAGYPEPDYEDVARARVLHVFKDRGGEEERVRAPAPGDLVPVLV